MATEIIFSTNNRRKADEVKPIFARLDISILTLEEAGIQGGGDEQKGAPLGTNATIKVEFAHRQRPDVWTIADDTGIFIDALDNQPGSDAALWGDNDEKKLSVTERMLYALEQMKEIPADNRRAVFKTCVAVMSPIGNVELFFGELEGVITEEPPCAPLPGMPYSAIFRSLGSDKVLAQMTIEEENAISHRGQAFRKARDYLKKELGLA